jgi:DNA-binding XRE family transcriptional regulator
MNKPGQDRFYTLLGSRIREHRVNANLKQETFAGFLKLSRASIVNIEKGRQRPSIYQIFEIANVLNVQVSDLFPIFEVEEKVNQKWKKIIAQKSTDKESKAKILGFIEEIQSS